MTQLIDLGKLRFYFAGTWSSAQEYELNDIVKYGGNVYAYTYALATTGNLPTNTSYWQFVIGGIDFKGTYSSGTAYKVGEAVSHGAIMYQCILGTTGNTPPNATYWTKISEGVQYEGTYAGGTQYQKNDIVQYGGSAFIALADTLGNTPNYSSNTAYWAKLVDGAYPDQTNHNLAILQTNGTTTAWADAPSLNSLALIGDMEVGGTLYVGAEADNFETQAELTSAKSVTVVDSGADPYGQIAFKNSSPTASTDVIVYSNNGTDTSGWMDMGITGSAFEQAEFGITGPNDGYIFYEAPEVLTATITNKALTGNVATLTTSAAHGFIIGQTVVVTGVDSTFNGNYVITGKSSTTFSYAKTASNVTSVAASGTAVVGSTGAGNLVIGTGDKGTDNHIVFGAGGFATGDAQMTIIPDDRVHIEIATESTSSSTGALTVAGGMGVQGNVNVAGNVAIVGNLTFGGGSTTADNLSVTDPLVFVGDKNQADVLDLGLVGEYATTVSAITATVSNKALTSNVATLTTSAAHTYLVGDVVVVTGVDATFNGTYSIASVPTSTTFTYAKTATNVTSAAASGSTSVSARRKFAGVVRDASDGVIKFFKDATSKPSSSVNFTEAGLAYGDVRVGGSTVTSISNSGTSTLTGNTTIGGTLEVTGLTTLTGGLTTSGTARITGRFDVQELREDVVTTSITSNVMAASYTAANVYYNGTAPTANYTLNLTNVPTDDAKTFSVSVVQVQGASGSSFIPSAVQIDGVAVSPALKWVGGTAPTPTATAGKIDIFTFTFMRVSSAWIVLGAASQNY
jgi:hypothetical protein